jgi:putative ABC transport system permease protein
MFFFTYLRRELRRRMRQAVVTSAGLALGIGLVITVVALSPGVRSAQGKVLGALFGVGTDITVTTAAVPASGSAGLRQITPSPMSSTPTPWPVHSGHPARVRGWRPSPGCMTWVWLPVGWC